MTLETALSSWMNSGGTLQVPRDHGVKTDAEARLVCEALGKSLSVPVEAYKESEYNLHTAIALFQDVRTQQAADRLRVDGLPQLRALVGDYLDRRHLDTGVIVFVAKILALYGDPHDASLIVRLAREPDCEDTFLWSIVFRELATAGKEPVRRVVEGLRQPLPGQFCRIAFLDFCNKLALAGSLKEHPFNSADGQGFLRQCLESKDETQWSYAVSATATLPFLDADAAGELASLARRHPSLDVQIESAWAAAKMGRDEGLDHLAALACDPRSAQRAIRYLEELGHAEKIPGQALTPEAQALAEMSHWLAHPNEQGRPPEEMSIADTQELFWPPTNDRRRLWVIKFKYPAEAGGRSESYGLVGSTTWSMTQEAPTNPRDVYAVHCCWELQMQRDPRAPAECSVAAGRRLLMERNPEFSH